ncbi:oligosaccharide flippase family protein [Methylomonas sp. SURF-2]|uniref:Oligosaccharide flippase family protein n=1 Tax=Methylomonas subterranea TaxID=2952225 RepID=A0ABT1TKC8_9GAMM|nr:oligosaccharide flippase family protein [Methylomonas sp. SURF-2]MCQ8105927.1 oligosaccharide flippase family protein [Methylomonas sp. SURF-2]
MNVFYGGSLKNKSIASSTLYFTGASILARVGGFVAQIVLGWILVKEEYGLFAITLSIASIFSCMRNGGTDQIIIQRGSEYTTLAPRIATFSIIFNVFICVLFLALSENISEYYGEPKLTLLLIVLAFGYLFATPGPILIAKLSIQKDFREISISNLITILSKHVLTIVLALLNFGIFSLLIPLAMQPLIGAVSAYFFVKSWPSFTGIRNVRMGNILRDSIWVIASNFAYQLSNNVQYFILGSYFSSSVIGVYFFAVQIINSPIALINGTVKSVVFPSLSGLLDDSLKYKNAVIKSIIVSYSIGALIGILGYLILPVLTDIIWKGKWNESIVFVRILCLIIPSGILINSLYEILASAGFWKDRFYLLALSIVVEMCSIWMVIDYLDMPRVALNMFLFRNIFLVLVCFYAIEKVCGTFSYIDIGMLFIPFSLVSGIMLYFDVFSIDLINSYAFYSLIFLAVCFYFLLLNRHMHIGKNLTTRLVKNA